MEINKASMKIEQKCYIILRSHNEEEMRYLEEIRYNMLDQSFETSALQEAVKEFRNLVKRSATSYLKPNSSDGRLFQIIKNQRVKT